METLPDYLKEGLGIVLVGLNPSVYSVREGHYFANPRNRFWRAFNRSGLVAADLSPTDDHTLLGHGIGLTDLVKRPTSQGSHLTSGDYRQWAPLLKGKLERYQPLITCFQGLTTYGNYLRYVESEKERPKLGLQGHTIGKSRVFVVPNPSPANAAFSVDDLKGWYRKLAALRAGVVSEVPGPPAKRAFLTDR